MVGEGIETSLANQDQASELEQPETLEETAVNHDGDFLPSEIEPMTSEPPFVSQYSYDGEVVEIRVATHRYDAQVRKLAF